MPRPELTPHGWQEVPTVPSAAPDMVISESGWVRHKVRLLSSLIMAEAPDGTGEIIPQWHFSITRNGRRPMLVDIKIALRALGLRRVRIEEDNHHPGNARHFFLPVDPARRVNCECKLTEETMRERDGYTWTNPTVESGEGCRGCELERIMAANGASRPCPIHT